jgi:hypothetical protein
LHNIIYVQNIFVVDTCDERTKGEERVLINKFKNSLLGLISVIMDEQTIGVFSAE